MTQECRIICHYDEVGIKGKNRPWFEKKLCHSIRFAIADIAPELKVKILRGRLLLSAGGEIDREEIVTRLQKLPGIAYFAEVFTAPARLEDLYLVLEKSLPAGPVGSFAVRAKRDDKSFPLNSQEIEREVGAWIVQNKGWKVDLSVPQLTVHLEWLRDRVLCYSRRIPGPGGLPIGASGKVLCLMSGGIDSPVAAYFMMKRGCLVNFIHFHSFPFTDSASQGKVRDLVGILCRHRCPTSLYLVPFAELQQEIVTSAPAPYRIILYRRFMLRIAQQIAQREKLQALVTGDSLGQVASQTLENLGTVGRVADLPVLRPLIAMDKREIISSGRQIGTYATSIEPHGDCCSWLMPSNPCLYSTPQQADEIEAGLAVSELVEKTLAQVTRENFFYPQAPQANDPRP